MRTATLKLGCSFCAERRGESNTDFDDVMDIHPENEEWKTYETLAWSGSKEDFEFEVAGTSYNRLTITRYIYTQIPDVYLEYALNQPPLLHRVVLAGTCSEPGLHKKADCEANEGTWTKSHEDGLKEQWLPLGGDWEDDKKKALGQIWGGQIYRRRLWGGGAAC